MRVCVSSILNEFLKTIYKEHKTLLTHNIRTHKHTPYIWLLTTTHRNSHRHTGIHTNKMPAKKHFNKKNKMILVSGSTCKWIKIFNWNDTYPVTYVWMDEYYTNTSLCVIPFCMFFSNLCRCIIWTNFHFAL